MGRFIGIRAEAVVGKDGQVKDWVVWCRSREKDEEQRPFEVDGEKIFSNRSKQAKPKAGEKTDKKGGNGQLVCWKAWWQRAVTALESVVATGQNQMRSE